MQAFAPAKVNLYLHVGARRADGFHPLSSLMVFADIGDELTAEPASGWSLRVTGELAAHAPAGGDNLVTRAARALADRAGLDGAPARVTLEKRLPAGAGLGGGSADAAAALRLLPPLLELRLGVAEIHDIAASLGSDVPACLASRPVLAQGRGEVLTPVFGLPDLPVVLARSPAAASTAAVYGAFDAGPAGAGADPLAIPPGLADARAVAVWLAGTRNDLERPAVALEPAIGETLAALRAGPGALFVRMSGSGSACFAICADAASAAGLASGLAAEHPDWWVRTATLRGA